MAENFFDESSTFKSSIGHEKRKLLTLIAEHGSAGHNIYEEAKARATTSKSGDIATLDSDIEELTTKYKASQRVFDEALTAAQEASAAENQRRSLAETIYKDSIAGDASLADEAGDMIDDISGSGGGGGRGGGGRGGGGGGMSGFGPGQGGTVPLGFFDPPDLNESWPGFEPGLVPPNMGEKPSPPSDSSIGKHMSRGIKESRNKSNIRAFIDHFGSGGPGPTPVGRRGNQTSPNKRLSQGLKAGRDRKTSGPR